MFRIQFEKIALIGIGLIGSSLARVIKKKNIAAQISIATRRPETLKRARELQLGDFYTTDNAKAVKGADLVILSVPVGASAEVAKTIRDHLKPGAIVSDVGSTKALVIRHFQQLQLLRYQVDVEGKSAFTAISQAQPPIFFQRKKTVERALSYWGGEQISYAMERIQRAVLDSRKNPHLGEAIIRQTLLGLAIVARRQMAA